MDFVDGGIACAWEGTFCSRFCGYNLFVSFRFRVSILFFRLSGYRCGHCCGEVVIVKISWDHRQFFDKNVSFIQVVNVVISVVICGVVCVVVCVIVHVIGCICEWVEGGGRRRRKVGGDVTETEV